MRRQILLLIICWLSAFVFAAAQSRRAVDYSESEPENNRVKEERREKAVAPTTPTTASNDDDSTIRVETDLVVVNVRVSERNGQSAPQIGQNEFRIFENDAPQQIALFSSTEQPFTVALVLDVSYSSAFKLSDIQTAAKEFIRQLRPNDRVIIVVFDEKPRVLCEATDNRTALRYAVEATQTGSGSSFYDSLDLVLRDKFNSIAGRKAVVVLTDGVDTTSRNNAKDVLTVAAASGAIVFPIEYDTFADVRKNRQQNTKIYHDDRNRRVVVAAPEEKGERKTDYKQADQFLRQIADRTDGRIYRVSSSTNLTAAFAGIADELRKIYTLGYYANDEKQLGATHRIKVRVYRPNLIVRTRDNSVWKP